MQLFVPLTKVDFEKREVWGQIADETPDDIGEVFDYTSSKPLFEEWSSEVQKASGGKSLGNVRSMHDKVAAGKLTALTMDDANKGIGVCAKIVDDGEWQKILEGVYTGFSLGGRYVRKWRDPKNAAHTRYTARPREVSLADLPSNPSTTFQLVKAAGVVEEVYFQKIAERTDTSPNEGEKKYGDVEYADPTNKKYPIDTEEHIRAAWRYINHADNAGKYSAADVASIKRKIVAAWKDKIDKDGPPSADAKKAAGATLHAEDLMDATVEQLTDALAKKMSAAQKDRVQAIHDHASAMGADCDTGDDAMKAVKADLQKRADELTKVSGERDAAVQKATALGAEVETLKTRVAELEKLPGAGKGASTTVEKGADMTLGEGSKKEEPLDPKDPDYSIKLMKRAQSQPIFLGSDRRP